MPDVKRIRSERGEESDRAHFQETRLVQQVLVEVTGRDGLRMTGKQGGVNTAAVCVYPSGGCDGRIADCSQNSHFRTNPSESNHLSDNPSECNHSSDNPSECNHLQCSIELNHLGENLRDCNHLECYSSGSNNFEWNPSDYNPPSSNPIDYNPCGCKISGLNPIGRNPSEPMVMLTRPSGPFESTCIDLSERSRENCDSCECDGHKSKICSISDGKIDIPIRF